MLQLENRPTCSHVTGTPSSFHQWERRPHSSNVFKLRLLAVFSSLFISFTAFGSSAIHTLHNKADAPLLTAEKSRVLLKRTLAELGDPPR